MRRFLALAMMITTTFGMAAVGRAEVNCEQVKKYAQTGRSVEDIADTMIVDTEAVKKCLEGQAANPQPTPAAVEK